ncbi:MAG: alanyl-tRNA editing protein [Anaerolineae bacterium]|nr:alanyl-tRNA editing protein [Anaerolineae bacterium]
MTERLYYTDSYTTAFTARVTEQLQVDNRPVVILDQTYFYPTSGGQPYDMGTLNGVPVVDVTVRETDAAILHILDAELTDEEVSGGVDWARRFDHMQHHTGQHILTQAFVQTADAKTVGFHLSPDTVTIDLETSSLSDARIDAAEELANQIIWENRPVTARLREMDDQEGVRIRRLPKHLLTDGLRVIDIEGFDITACGGTHVSRTGEIGIIKVLKLEKRGGKIRVEFRCGKRALADLREKNRVVQRIAADLDCRVTEAPVMLARLRKDYRTQTAALKTAANQLIDYEAAEMLTNAPSGAEGIKVITAAFEGRDAGELKLLAARLVAHPGVIALIGTAGEKAMLFFARSENLPNDMGALLKSTLTALGGRGGGQPNFAQGGGIALEIDALREALKTAARQL